MKKETRSLFLILMLAVLVLSISISAMLIGQRENTFANTTGSYNLSVFDTESIDNNSVIITLTESESKKFKNYSVNDFKEVCCVEVEDMTSYTDNYAKTKSRGGYSSESMLVEVDNYKKILKLDLGDSCTDNIIKAIDVLNKRDDVLVAGPNFIYTIDTIPNDTYWGNDGMWGFNGQYGIQAESAWNISMGANPVTVGVLDTGIQANHPDLVNRISTAGLHRDCTVDPIKAVSSTELVDPHGHGTHVAGIIGAQGNNSTGVCGVCWNVSLVSLRAFNENGKGDTASLVRAINFAASQNIPILNYSGGSNGVQDNTLINALNNYKGLFVCAAGNGGDDYIGDNNDRIGHYPSNYSYNYACSARVISVGSINEDGTRSDFSNYGPGTVSLFAPGYCIYSTLPNNKYGVKSGTSMATPFVTGVAALLLSTDNTLIAYELKQMICANVDKDSKLNNLCSTGGRLNAYNAIGNIKYTLNLSDGSTTKKQVLSLKDEISIISVPTQRNYEFEGYYTGKNGAGTKYIGAKLEYTNGYYSLAPENLGKHWHSVNDLNLYAKWTQLEMDYYYGVYVQDGDPNPIATEKVHIIGGEKTTLSAPPIKGYTFSKWIVNGDTFTDGTVTRTIYLHRSYVTGEPDIYYYTGGPSVDSDGYIRAIYNKDGKDDPCVAEGTLITLADGSQKPVELLTGNEQLLVWNLNTGSFDCAPILFIDSDAADYYEIINLYFSDGTSVKVASEHAFWDFNLNKYIYLRNDAEKYIGHWFNKQITKADGTIDWTKVQLTDVVINTGYTTTWSPVTYGHLCYYVNGMLSMPGGIEGLFNIFEVDAETLTYNKSAYEADIATYGLFTYEEFCELYDIPELMFDACGGQYLKVAIGKGLLDYSTLSGLVERYGVFFEN